MQVTVNTTSSRHYQAADERGMPLGDMRYTSWTMSDATITNADGLVYNIAGKGFWQTNKSISRNGVEIAELKPNMRNGFYITLANGNSITFKRRGLWSNGGYLLLDEQGAEAAVIRSEFKWRSFNFNYEIEINPNTLPNEINSILPFLLIYCVKYMRMRSSAAT